MRLIRTVLCGLAILSLVVPATVRAETEIVYWDFFKPGDGSPRGNALAENLKRFQAKYPDIRVKVEVLRFAEVESKLIQGAAAGSTPDVARVYSYALPLHISAESIQPLDRFAEKMDKGDWLLPWNSTVFAGKKFALPAEHRFFTLLYRKDLLEKAGVKVPTTWDEMCQAAGKINSPQVMGYAFGVSQGSAAYYLLEWVENMIITAGGQLFDEKGRANVNNAAGRKFFQVIADLAGKCKASGQAVVQFTYNEIHEGLKTGTIAMAGLGTHRYQTIRAEGAGENLHWAPPPSFEKGKQAPVNVIGWNLVMGKYAKHPEAAWKFMEFMASPDTQVITARAGETPSRKSAYKDPWFQTSEAKVMREWSEYIIKNGRSGRYPTGWLEFGQILAQGAQAVVLKGVASGKAWDDVVERYNKSLEGKK